jgi:hypothetical protein
VRQSSSSFFYKAVTSMLEIHAALGQIDFVYIGIGLWFLFNCIIYGICSRSSSLMASGRMVMRGLTAKNAVFGSACIMMGLIPSCRFPILDWIVIGLFVLSILLLPTMTVFMMAAGRQRG